MIFFIDLIIRISFFLSLSAFFGIVGAYAEYEAVSLTDDESVDDFSIEERQRLFYEAMGTPPKKADPRFVIFLDDIKGRLVLSEMHDIAVADLLLAVRDESMWAGNRILQSKLISLLNRAESYVRKNGTVLQIKNVDDLVHEAFAIWPAGPDKKNIAHMIESFTQRQNEKIEKELERERDAKEREEEKVHKQFLAEEERRQKEADRKEREEERELDKKQKKARRGASRARKTKSDEEKETKTVKSSPVDRVAAPRARKKVSSEVVGAQEIISPTELLIDPVPEYLPEIGIEIERQISTTQEQQEPVELDVVALGLNAQSGEKSCV
ncbi:hypothetical protein FJ366_03340 [Candidatus Dependentiae bacterium]|nr:hypothetical protein [Candidatus Dependentiae bacterium]